MKEGAKQRNVFANSAHALRRMRRLYAHLVVKEIKDLDMDTIYYLSARLQQRGFYSLKTGKKDVFGAFMRHLYKQDLEWAENTHIFHRTFKTWLFYRGLRNPWEYHIKRWAA